MTAYDAAVLLIREADLCRLLRDASRATARDWRALYEARRRYDGLRRAS